MLTKTLTKVDKIAIKITRQKQSSYTITIGRNILPDYKLWLSQYTNNPQLVIITDKIVEHLIAKQFADELSEGGYKVLLLSIVPGEESKSSSVKEHLEGEMLKYQYDRHTLLLAVGGGIVGDLAGFIAATYMRGINYIQIPTTALAMIDSSVGGKTAINTQYGKNLIGAFWQPQAVIMDLNLLDSLPKIQLINGIIEALKIYLTLDAASFAYAKLHLDDILKRNHAKLQRIIKRAVQLKAGVVMADEREENLRMILNFGHTIGHALEKLSNFQILHGYAVALGILVEARIAQLMGLLSSDNYELIAGVFYRLGINREMLTPFNAVNVNEEMITDKKSKESQIHCVLLKDIGA
ncbi:MAG: 3-dehydroquinate synthase, partial [Pseudomonadota bacterium]|nr:3-dehydroquinate synthase [Pseudomonadota bacterium]